MLITFVNLKLFFLAACGFIKMNGVVMRGGTIMIAVNDAEWSGEGSGDRGLEVGETEEESKPSGDAEVAMIAARVR
jgi:hypothetical protein